MRRGLTLNDFGKVVQRSTSSAQRYCLRADHPDYTPPPREVEARIVEWSGGKITFANHAELWSEAAEDALGGLGASASADRIPEGAQ